MFAGREKEGCEELFAFSSAPLHMVPQKRSSIMRRRVEQGKIQLDKLSPLISQTFSSIQGTISHPTRFKRIRLKVFLIHM